MFKAILAKWKNRKKYKTFEEMPDPLVVFFGLSGFLVSGSYGWVLSKVVPDFLEIANRIPLSQWGWKGWVLTSIIAALGFMVWHFGSVAWRCNGILRDRWYK
ncbi:hypothetical protein GL58_07195 [Comamonas testosteroni]|uniref:Uncharacterized protein n=1 Tax=Comamonas testosteroni TaxID=285 RepID=A0A0L7MJY6_COMTE|nr:hypothetical protein [Comamonas testosteroni]KOC22246.1 hypothetical protein GL58_07195 [Comamonas testosteroni]